MPANLDAILAPRRRASQPTAFERRLGFNTHQRTADLSNRTRRCAPLPDRLANIASQTRGGRNYSLDDWGIFEAGYKPESAQRFPRFSRN